MGPLEGAVAIVSGSLYGSLGMVGILRVAGFDKGGIWTVHETSETQGSEYLLIGFKWSALLKCDWIELGGSDQVTEEVVV